MIINKDLINGLQKLPSRTWLLILSIILMLSSGILCQYVSDPAFYQAEDINKIIITSISIIAPVLLPNVLLGFCLFQNQKLPELFRLSFIFGCFITSIVFIFLSLFFYAKVLNSIVTPLFCAVMSEGVIFMTILFITTQNRIIRYIRKISILHWVLGILNIISVVLILQIVFRLLPLFSCNLTIEQVERINSLLVDLSIGIITSTLFYYLLAYIPEKKRNKRVRKLIQARIDHLGWLMQVVVAYLCYKFKVKAKSPQLLDANFATIPNIGRFSQDKIDFWISNTKNDVNDVTGSTELGFLHNYLDLIKRCSTQINSSNVFQLEELQLQAIVLKIMDCRLIADTEFLYNNKTIPMSIGNLAQNIQEFYKLYVQLSEYISLKNITIKGDKPSEIISVIYS